MTLKTNVPFYDVNGVQQISVFQKIRMLEAKTNITNIKMTFSL